MMKNLIKHILLATAVVAAAGCAKTIQEGANEANQRYLDAWMKVQGITEEQKVGRGIYVLSQIEAPSADVVEADGYAFVNYRTTDLEGNITAYTDREAAEQLGEYDPSKYYGPKVWLTTAETIRAGVFDGISGMTVGSQKRFLVPPWMMSYKNFATEEEYLAQASENPATIYEVKIEGFTKDINEWQFSEMVATFNSDDFYGGRFKGTDIEDTVGVGYGILYKNIEAIKSEEAFASDTTIYINYTGKLLNGLVFDTNIEKTAKDNNLYNPDKKYGPTAVQWASKYSEITLDKSSVIGGFARTLWQMGSLQSGSKGVGMFYSELGYGYSGSGNIPGYAPLIFEIEIVDAP